MSAVTLHCGDARDVLTTLPDASVDAVVTDPPAGISFMNLAFDGNRGGRGQWIAWLAGIMAEARRCIRPGGYALVWALPRTSHWTATALDDGGWRIIDIITHHFGQGFPKGKGQLKPATEHWILCRAPGPLQPLQIDACRVAIAETVPHYTPSKSGLGKNGVYGASTREQGANSPTRYDGRGRWPSNLVLSHHPDCQPLGVRRVKGAGWRDADGAGGHKIAPGAVLGNRQSALPSPANGHHTDADGYESVDAWTCVDGCPVAELDRQAGYSSERPRVLQRNGARQMEGWGLDAPSQGTVHGDAGGKSRFFPTFGPDPQDTVPFRYEPKASRRDRGQGNTHSTVKPTALMAWLCTLVTPEHGVVLDPFGGSMSTGVACVKEGFSFIGIEMNPEYVAIGRARLEHAQRAKGQQLAFDDAGALASCGMTGTDRWGCQGY